MSDWQVSFALYHFLSPVHSCPVYSTLVQYCIGHCLLEWNICHYSNSVYRKSVSSELQSVTNSSVSVQFYFCFYLESTIVHRWILGNQLIASLLLFAFISQFFLLSTFWLTGWNSGAALRFAQLQSWKTIIYAIYEEAPEVLLASLSSPDILHSLNAAAGAS